MVPNEQELSIAVQKYPVIFDKSNKDFHRKDVKKNAWEAVAKELGFENGKYSSSPSRNNKDNCKKMMLVNRRHFENNDFKS